MRSWDSTGFFEQKKPGGNAVEYDYMEYRKDSQAALREKNSRGEKMDGFHSSEKRRKEGREPEKELEIGNSYGKFELGATKQSVKSGNEKNVPEKIAVVSGLRKDRKKELRDHEQLQESRAVPIELLQKRVLVNPHRKEKSAAALRLEQEKTGNRLAAGLSEMEDQGKLETVKEMLPFLDSRREQEERKRILEEQEVTGKLSTEKNKYLDSLKENELHKQREKQKFVQAADRILKNKSEEIRPEDREHGGNLEEYLKKLWSNILMNEEEEDENIDNNDGKL